MWKLVKRAIYRTLVGHILGAILAGLVGCIGVALSYLLYGHELPSPSNGQVALCLLMAFSCALVAGYVGGLAGAWLAHREIAATALRGSLVAILLGFFAGLPVAFFIELNDLAMMQLILNGAAAGVVSAIVARWQTRPRTPLNHPASDQGAAFPSAR